MNLISQAPAAQDIPQFGHGTRPVHSNLQDPQVYSPAIWNELRIFLAVAKNNSFNAAAAELGVSQPTVSRAVKNLEGNLGQTLVLADQRGVKLTPKGEEIALVCSKLDLSLADMALHLRQINNTLTGRVSVQVAPDIATTWLVPEFAKLSVSHPGLLVDIFDNDKQDIDLRVSTRSTGGDGFAVEILGILHFNAFASHLYIDQHGKPNKSNISEHSFLQLSAYENGELDCNAWNQLVGDVKLKTQTNQKFSYTQMAKLGTGVAFLPNYATMTNDFVPLNLGVIMSQPFYLHRRIDTQQDDKVSKIRDLVRGVFDGSEWFGTEFIIRPSGARNNARLQDHI